MATISIIIPAYNVEKYIERCLNSIFCQNIPDEQYEVIVINDGSTDNTLTILQKQSEIHSNLRIVSQKNQGPSTARNSGIDLAKGDYIWFVDSDDYIVECCLALLLSVITAQKLDILYFTFEEIGLDASRTKRNIQPVSKNKIINGKNALKEGFYPSSSCIALWNRNYLDRIKLRFSTNIMYAEDSLFSFTALCQANNVMFIDESFYVYERREGSSTTKAGEEKIIKQKLSDIVVIKSIENLSEKYKHLDPELSNLIKKHSQKILFGLVYTLYRNRKKWKNINKTVIAKLKEEKLYPLKGPFHSFKKLLIRIFLNQEFYI